MQGTKGTSTNLAAHTPFCYCIFLTLNDGDLLMSDVYILLHALDSASLSVLSLLQDGFTKRRLEPCFLDWTAR